MNFVDKYVTPFTRDYLVPTLVKVAIAALILWLGFKLIKKIGKFITKQLTKREIDASLVPFLVSIITIGLKAILIITAIGIAGVPTTSFAAILAAAGLAVGMALSGTLQNFAGGVMILLFKPFKVGDVIEAQGYTGVVKEISIFVTTLTTFDNKTIIQPNGPLSNGSMVNYSTEPLRRVDWSFGIGYGDDTNKAREVLKRLLAEESKVLSQPQEAFVEVSALADSSVNFAVRAWVKQEDYWNVFFSMNEKVYNEFNEVGLNIPYPQMDVHVHQNNS